MKSSFSVIFYDRGKRAETKVIRKALRLTQHEFATALQLSLAMVRDWEQGRYPTDQAARTLLRVIACDPKAIKRDLEVFKSELRQNE
ncbi:MAG: helix-turn-helix domain-containing protein [Gemmatimonadetes bacterium]|nr:helix-turn-helix domain-containing protein [Gemmatimonadota bacterium]MBT5328692.1 helix-turn-helix domain-containing protein [Gemmatimonadota bacterium]MBT5448367.1 helix-turn-helix domain-containing protein [Gemmatimonadota bacterium]MBT5804522.1 helix-turn-helix domain-containing protein [Gemmatimonadota bacterium]MBT6618938.1 helix-turn-helix domain-containing protein [Gemmatimonadota bacterium]